MKKFVLLPLLVAVWLLTGLVAQGKAPSPSGGEHEPVRKNADNRLADIGGLVSGFGGMYIDPDNPDVLNVFLLDSASKEKKENVEDAIRSNFPGSIPSGGIAVVQGQYSMSQLQDWYAKVIKAMASTNLVGNGLVGTDLEEDKNRLEIAVEDSESAAVVEGVLAGLADVPRDAVRVTVRGRFRFLSGAKSLFEKAE